MARNLSHNLKRVVAGLCAVLVISGAAPVQPIGEYLSSVAVVNAVDYSASDLAVNDVLHLGDTISVEQYSQYSCGGTNNTFPQGGSYQLVRYDQELGIRTVSDNGQYYGLYLDDNGTPIIVALSDNPLAVTDYSDGVVLTAKNDTNLVFAVHEKTPVYTPPTTVNPNLTSYSGEEQQLFVPGSVTEGGRLYYGVTRSYDDNNPRWTSSSMLTATDAGTYYLWYKVDANSGYKSIDCTYVGAVTIDKIDSAVTSAPESKNIIYKQGTAQALVTPGVASGGTMMYAPGRFEKRDNIKEDYVPAIGDIIKPYGDNGVRFPSGYSIKIGDTTYSNSSNIYGIHFYIDNGKKCVSSAYNIYGIETVWYSSGKDAFKVTAVDTENKVATIEFVDYDTAVAAYVITADNNIWSEDIPTGTDKGGYSVSYMVSGDSNHNNTAISSVTSEIKEYTEAEGNIGVVYKTDKTYDGNALTKDDFTISAESETAAASLISDTNTVITVTDNATGLPIVDAGTYTAKITLRNDTSKQYAEVTLANVVVDRRKVTVTPKAGASTAYGTAPLYGERDNDESKAIDYTFEVAGSEGVAADRGFIGADGDRAALGNLIDVAGYDKNNIGDNDQGEYGYMFAADFAEIKVGDESSGISDYDIPVSISHNYSASASIYTSEELGGITNIVDASYYMTYDGEFTKNIEVYVAETTKTSFNSKDAIDVSTMTKVYDGSWSVTNGWNRIVFDKTFTRTNLNKNLIIAFVDKSNSSASVSYRFAAMSTENNRISIYAFSTDNSASLNTTKAKNNVYKIPVVKFSDYAKKAYGNYELVLDTANTFTVDKKTMTAEAFAGMFTPNALVYNKSEQTAAFTATDPAADNDSAVVTEDDYALTGTVKGTNADTYTATIAPSADGNYALSGAESVDVEWTISPNNIENATRVVDDFDWSDIDSTDTTFRYKVLPRSYNANTQNPEIELYFGNTKLVRGFEYDYMIIDCTVTDNTNKTYEPNVYGQKNIKSDYKFAVTGVQNYTGIFFGTWGIDKTDAKTIEEAVTLSAINKVYDAKTYNDNTDGSSDVSITANDTTAALANEIANAQWTYTYCTVDEEFYNSESKDFASLTYTNSAPKNAGYYAVKATLTGDNFEETSLYDIFEIEKRPVTLTPKALEEEREFLGNTVDIDFEVESAPTAAQLEADSTLDPDRGWIKGDKSYNNSSRIRQRDWSLALIYDTDIDNDGELNDYTLESLTPVGEYEIIRNDAQLASTRGRGLFGNYEISVTPGVNHTITPYDLSNNGDNISIVYENKNADDDNYTPVAYNTDGYPYNGREYRVRVKANEIGKDPVTYVLYDYGNKKYPLTQGTDFTLDGTISQTNAISDNADPLYAKIVGRGNFKGTYQQAWRINQADNNITKVKFDGTEVNSADIGEVSYNGETLASRITVEAVGITTPETTMTFWKYDENAETDDYKGDKLTDAPKNAGKYVAEVVVTDSDGNYKPFSCTFTVTITKLDVTVKPVLEKTEYRALFDTLPTTVSSVTATTGSFAEDETTTASIKSQIAETYSFDDTSKKFVAANGTIELANYNVTCAASDAITITQVDLSDGKAVLAADTVALKADGATAIPLSAIHLKYKYTDNGTEKEYILTAGTDFEFASDYSVTTAGNAAVQIKGKGQFKGTLDATVAVAPVIMKATNARLDGAIGLNFKVVIPQELLNDEGAYATFKTDNRTVTMLVSDAYYEESTGRHVFTYNVIPKEFADVITVKFFNSKNEQISFESTTGTKYNTEGLKYSMKKYIDGRKANGSEKMKKLAVAMEDYYTAAQIYFKYGDYQNLSVSKQTSSVKVSDISKDCKGYYAGDKPKGLKSLTTKMRFEEVTSFKVYVNFVDGYSSNDYKYMLDGEEVQITYDEDENRYYFRITDICAKELDKMHTFSVSDKDGNNTYTLGYGVLSYAIACFDYDSRLQLGQALYRYNQAAKEYFGQ